MIESKTLRIFSAWITSAAAIVGFTAGSAWAGSKTKVEMPLSAHVPAGVVFYTGWAGQPKSWPGYKSSRLARVLPQSHFAALFRQDLPVIIAAYANGNPQAIKSERQFRALASMLFNHRCAFYVMPASGRHPKTLSIGIIIKANHDRKKILAELKKCQVQPGNSPPTNGVKVRSGHKGAWVYDFVNPTAAMRQALAGGPTLPTDPLFRKAVAPCLAHPTLGLYINFLAARGDMGLLAVNARKIPQIGILLKSFKPSGPIKEYRTYAMSAGFADGQWRQDSFLAYRQSSARRGHAQDLLKLAPANALDMSVFHLNLTKLTSTVLKAAKVNGQGKVISQGLETVNEMTGVDLRQDIIDALGARWLMYELPTPGLPSSSGYVLANRLRHPNRLMQALAVLMPVAVMGGNAMFKQRGMTGAMLSLNSVQIGNVTINEVGNGTAMLCYAIDNDNFFITLNVNAMRAAIAQESAKTSVLNNPAFQRVLAELGNPQSPATVSFTDSPKLLAAGYKLLTVEMPLPLTMAGIQLPVPLDQIAPPLKVLSAALEPSGAVSWFGHSGWHQRSIGAFPLAGIFTAQAPSNYLGFFSSAWSADPVPSATPAPAGQK